MKNNLCFRRRRREKFTLCGEKGNAKLLPVLLAVACAALLMAGIGRGDAKRDELLRVDGHRVTLDEFTFFLNNERANTAAYFGREYNARIDAGFWNRSYNGEIPVEYAKREALKKSLAAKMEEILFVERGLAAEVGYDAFLKEYEEANAERARKLASGEVVYGLVEYDLPTYYQYRRAQRWSDLLRYQIGMDPPATEELMALYMENAEMFSNETELLISILYPDGREERLALSRAGIPKEDSERRYLLDEFSSMKIGEAAEAYWNGEEVVAVLREKTSLGSAGFEDTRPALAAIYAENELRRVIADRVEKATVKINEKKWNEIGF